MDLPDHRRSESYDVIKRQSLPFIKKEGLLLFRGILLLSCLLSFFPSPLKNSKLVSYTSTFGSSSTASPFFASVLSGILRGFYAFRSRWLLLSLWFLVWSFLPAVLLGL